MPDRKPSTVLPPAAEKRSYVRRMFTVIAPRYDLMNRLMTLGRDRIWRRTTVRFCALPRNGYLLDVATGTGDIAFEALSQDASLRVTGVDLTREMMLRGRSKHTARSFPFLEGDALTLPFGDNTFDAACSGFMMRNVLDVRSAFAEQVRVVKAGGRVVCLEITRPASRLFRPVFDLYFFRLVPLIGGLISGQPQAYRYLPQSTVDFPRPAELARIMLSVGLRDVCFRTAMLGTVALHWGTK